MRCGRPWRGKHLRAMLPHHELRTLLARTRWQLNEYSCFKSISFASFGDITICKLISLNQCGFLLLVLTLWNVKICPQLSRAFAGRVNTINDENVDLNVLELPFSIHFKPVICSYTIAIKVQRVNGDGPWNAL